MNKSSVPGNSLLPSEYTARAFGNFPFNHLPIMKRKQECKCLLHHCPSTSKNHHVFIPFPKEESLRNKWFGLCTRTYPKSHRPNLPKKCSVRWKRFFVCSLHFKPEDFERNLARELLDNLIVPSVKIGVLPSLSLLENEKFEGEEHSYSKPR